MASLGVDFPHSTRGGQGVGRCGTAPDTIDAVSNPPRTSANPPRTSANPLRAVILLSGVGSTAAALLQAERDPVYGVRIVAVGSDSSSAAGLERAREAGAATFVVKPRDFVDRAAWDRALTATIDVFSPDLVLCAGFMRILGPAFLGTYEGRTLNTHPSLLPAFPGVHAVRDALAYGSRVTGCTVHLVDAGVDTGPVLAQAAVEVVPRDDEASLHARIKLVERDLYVHVVGRMARQGWRVEGRHVVVG
jgi:phosphoribosylglycinamide formyltransferase-1